MKKTRIFSLFFYTVLIFGSHTAQASYGGLNSVAVTGPNQITATFEHALATYDSSPYTNLGLGLRGRNITDVISSTSNSVTFAFDAPPIPPNTTGTIDIAPIDWADEPGGFAGVTNFPVNDGQIPTLGVVTLQDLDNSGGLSSGDTLAFRFSEPMQRNITAETIDSYFLIGDEHTFGTVGNGLTLLWNDASTILTLTLASDASLAPGDSVLPLSTFTDVAGNSISNTSDPLPIPFIKITPRTLYFYNSGEYADWTDAANWWDDPEHTIQASSVPNEYDNIVIDSTVSPFSDNVVYVNSVIFSSLELVDPENLPLNFFFAYVNAPGGIVVNNNWNLLGYFVGNVSFNNLSAAGLPFFVDGGGFGTYFSASDIVGNVTFNGPENANYGTIHGPTIFRGNYGNAGLIYGNTQFYDSTSNPGIIFGDVVFRDNTGNGGIIYGSADVYSPAQNPLSGFVDDSIAYYGYGFDGGAGTEEDPYLISSCTQLQNIKNELSAHYKLTADIDCSDSSTWNENPDEWEDGVVGGTLIPDSYASVTHTSIVVENNGYFGFEPIGTPEEPFTGSLDGDGHAISNLWIFRKTTPYVGLFGNAEGATFTNMTLTNSNIVGGNNTGGIVGFINEGQASHITLNNNMVRTYLQYNGGGFAGTVTAGMFDHIQNNGGYVHGSGNVIGGIVGYLQGGTITDSYATAAVDGGLNVGGFVGQMTGGEITKSFAGGNVVSNRSEWIVMKTGYNVGGFVGDLQSGSISHAYATGDITSSGSYAGGFVGRAGSEATISNAYATGDVSGLEEVFEGITFTPDYVGGFAGFADASHFSKTFATGNVISQGSYTGGHTGFITYAFIHDAYATGTVDGESGVGGFGGYMSQDSDVANIYARGAVTSLDPDATGGLIGVRDNGATPIHSFWDTQTVGLPTTGDPSEKTTEQMKTQSTFTDAGWDFDTIWSQTEGLNNGYPLFIFTLTPEVSAVTPLNGATDISTTTPIVIRFSIPMNTSSAVITTSPCTQSCPSYTQTWSDNDQTLTLEKTGDPFALGTTYTITITSTSSAGSLALSEPYTWAFTIREPEPVVEPEPVPTWTKNTRRSVNLKVLNSVIAPLLKSASVTKNEMVTTPTVATTAVTPSQCAAALYPTKPIKFGAANDSVQVTLLQRYLNTYENAALPITGIYSTQDRDAVIAWQEKYAATILAPWNLTKGTGYVYTTSLQKLKELFLTQCQKTAPTTDILTIGMTGEAVKLAQQILIQKNSGPAARLLSKKGATGYFGKLTKAAVVEFQKSVGIAPATGNVGPKTKNILDL